MAVEESEMPVVSCRRRFFSQSAGALALAALGGRSAPSILAADDRGRSPISEYLQSIAPTAERVNQFTEIMTPGESVKRSNGWTYDSDLGWLHCPAIHTNGVDGSKTFYSYEPDGARRGVQFSDQPCRIHAFGNSFTHCDQVSDGETWEEYLATHLREPIRNYGVGGFSVYQAYQRMRLVESQRAADYLILNIYEDDHFRNLDAWRSIRVGSGSSCGFTLPHLRVNLAANRCEPVDNLLPDRSEVGRLRNASFRETAFAEDPILRIRMATRASRAIGEDTVKAVAESVGFPETDLPDGPPEFQIRKIHTEASLFATAKVIEWTEEFAQRGHQKLMILLSFGRRRMKEALSAQPLFDQTLLDRLAGKPYPVIDLRHAFAEAYRSYQGGLDAFLAPYYIGHHTPRGNYFTAWAIKDDLVKWLDPSPLPYQR